MIKKTILILEDEKALSEVIKAKLEAIGFATITARSVNQALGYQKTGVRVDLIWLDHYLLGEGNGLDFVTKIKQKGSAWKNLPVFVVSNTVSPEKIEEYFNLGVEKCYVKVNIRLDQIIKDIKKRPRKE